MSQSSIHNIEPDHRSFSPRDYLQQFYTTPQLANDEVAISQKLIARLSRNGRIYDRALEVGCGPTIHHAVPLVPFVRELHLSDYLPANLAEVRRWLDAEPDCFDWRNTIRGIFEIAGVAATEAAIAEREQQLRSAIAALKPCDLLQDQPLGEPAQYELVTTFYTAECAAGNRERWPAVMDRLLSLVAPGGSLFVGTMLNCSWYSVFDRKFPAAPVTEADYRELLPRYGFAPERTEIESIKIPDWADEGFDAILIVSGTRDS